MVKMISDGAAQFCIKTESGHCLLSSVKMFKITPL